MRQLRLRIKVRQLIVALGVIALVLAMRRQSALYHRRAEAYAWITFHHGSAVLDEDGQFVDRDPVTWVRDAWARKMAERYWRLSDYPWLLVEPDPPPPPEARSHLTHTLEPPRGTRRAGRSVLRALQRGRFSGPVPVNSCWRRQSGAGQCRNLESVFRLDSGRRNLMDARRARTKAERFAILKQINAEAASCLWLPFAPSPLALRYPENGVRAGNDNRNWPADEADAAEDLFKGIDEIVKPEKPDVREKSHSNDN